MRDIREDLRQRLAAMRRERDEMQAQLKAKLLEIDQYEEHLGALLVLEEKRVGVVSAVGVAVSAADAVGEASRPKAEQTVAEINAQFEADILDILADGADWPHPRIKAEMEKRGWVSDEKSSLGRQIQGVLLSLSRNRGLVEFVGKSVWRKAAKVPATAA